MHQLPADHSPIGLLERNHFRLPSIDALPRLQVLEALEQQSVVRISGLVDAEEIRQSIKALRRRFRRCDDHPSTGEAASQVKTNFQKLLVGSAHGPHYIGSCSRLLRTFYNPLWEEDIYGMHSIFRTMISLRNRLADKPDDFATTTISEGLWTAARIHQYPRGGGFMSSHRDQTASAASRKGGLNYYQLVLVMSRKGVDFESGGAFLERENQVISVEDSCEIGDIVIYNGSSVHGVATIDPHHRLDLDTISGRLAAFVSVYQDLGA